ncbi:cytokine receptor common subunit beta-like [Lissotriton helveticus]
MMLSMRRHSSHWITLFLLLGFANGKHDHQGRSSPLDTLQCYNNYRNQTTCRWKESVAARQFVKLRLYSWQNLNISANKTYDPIEPGRDLGHYVALTSIQGNKNQEEYSIRQIDHYSFIPDKPLETRLSINPRENIRLLPPLKLEVEASNVSGDFLLSWETAYDGRRSRLTSEDLEHEVQYKRNWEAWEGSRSLLVSRGTNCTLGSRQLVPGSTYDARVRVRLREGARFSRNWSEWSSMVSWEVPEGMAAAPKNLQCSFDATDRMKCTWEMRAEVTESVSFVLYYRESSQASETPCHPEELKPDPRGVFRFYSCEFLLSDPEELGLVQISVRPQTKTKSFRQCLNIQPFHPTGLKAEPEEDGQVYHLSWNPQPLGYSIQQHYQLCYHKQETNEKAESADQFSLDCPPHWKEVNITNGPPTLSFNLKTQLEPHSRYTAKVRAHVNSGDPTKCFAGLWSEWSTAIIWETGAAWDPQILYVLLLVGVIFLLAAAVPCYNYLKRSKRRWEDEIPNPNKSKLLANFLQKGSLALQSNIRGPGGAQQYLPETEDPSSCCLLTKGLCKDVKVMASSLVKAETPHPARQELHGSSKALSDQGRLHGLISGHSCGSQSFPLVVDNYKSTQPGTIQYEGSASSDFNGPYLLFQRTLWQSENSATEHPDGKEEYISFPPNWNTKMLPVSGNSNASSAHFGDGTKMLPASGSSNASSAHFGYVLCPPEAMSDPAEPKTQNREFWKHQLQTKADACKKSPSLDKLETLTNQAAPPGMEEALSTCGPIDYVMAPPSLLLTATNLPTTSSLNGQHEKPFTDPDCSQVLIPVLTKQEAPSGYVITPTIPNRATSSSAPLTEFNKNTREPSEDRLLIFSPGEASPILLQQIGDYCFLPSSNVLENNMEGEKVPPAGDPPKLCMSMAPEASQFRVPQPHTDVFKLMKNENVAVS